MLEDEDNELDVDKGPEDEDDELIWYGAPY
jgi:hypothetical protein